MTKRLNAFLHYLIKQLLISSTAFSAQMTEDEEIVFRVFEYGFGHAYKNRTYEDGSETMIFPRPCIIYLDEGKKDKIPDEYTLVLKFENQGEFFYKVPVFKLQNISLQELNDKKLIALLPFLLLKLRKKMEKIRSKENMEELQNLFMNDIMSNIEKNMEVGNISSTDAMDLKALTSMLYMRIYSKYQEWRNSPCVFMISLWNYQVINMRKQ